MSNLIFGISTVLFCSMGYFLSWRYQLRDRYHTALLLLMVCGLALRLYTSFDFYLHPWDERYHALVAKNLIQHPLMPTLYDEPVMPFDYKNWTQNHVWVHKQPLPLWSMALSMWLFGINEIALRMPSIILTTIGVWLTYYIGQYFFTKRIAYIAAFLYSINGLIIELTAGRVATDHIDIFFLFFIELAVFFSIMFSQKKHVIYTVLTGVSLGLAILTKWLPALIVLPIWLLIVFDSGRFKLCSTILNFVLLVSSCLAVFLPWQLYIHHTFPQEAIWEASFNIRHITEALDNHNKPFYFFIDRIRINYGELIYLSLVWLLWRLYQTPRDVKRLALAIWFFVPLMFFTLVKTKMQAYVLFTAPALFIITADFFYMLWDYQKGIKIKWVKWLIMVVLILMIALPVRYAIERIKPFEVKDRKPEWVTQLKKLGRENIHKGVLFNYSRPVEAMFYTDLIVYESMPEYGTIMELANQGYTVLINNGGEVPANISMMEEVRFIDLDLPINQESH